MTQLLLARASGFLKAGRPADAIAPLRQAASLAPFDAAIQHDLGLACLETGLFAEALAAFQCAIEAKPGYAEAYLRLGIAHEKLGDTPFAVAAYDRATELRPALAEAWFRAGALVFTLGHREAAIGCFRRAAAAGPKTPFGRLGQARAHLAEGNDAEAERRLRQTLALDPANAIAHDLLGTLLAETGRFAEARAAFARALEHAPRMAGTYYDLVRCRPVTADDADLLARMQAALATPGLEDAQILRLHLAIGKAANDLGDYALAMRHFDDADAVRRRTSPFDPAEFAREIDRLIATFTPERLAQPSGSDDPTPVLIVGMPRSGTTLVEQILSSHPEVAPGGELNFWSERGPGFYDALREGRDAAFLHQTAADYLAMLRAIGPGAARITDKRPFNFLWAGLVHLAFPRATILHCRRAPIDTALSIHQTHFNPGLAFPTGGPALVAYIRCYEKLTDHWRRTLPPERFLEIDYETLTADPEPVIRRLLAACGLPWNALCLHPDRNARAIRTASKWQARQPINRNAVGRWRHYGPWLGPLSALLDARPF